MKTNQTWLSASTSHFFGVLLIPGLVFLGGCATDGGRTRAQGAGIGALGGAAVGTGIGAIAGGGDNLWIGALAGGVIGGAGGLIYGDQTAKAKEKALVEETRLTKEIAASQRRLSEAQTAKSQLKASITSLTAEKDRLAAMADKTSQEYKAKVAAYTSQVQEKRAAAAKQISDINSQVASNAQARVVTGEARTVNVGDSNALAVEERKLNEERRELERILEQFVQLENAQRV